MILWTIGWIFTIVFRFILFLALLWLSKELTMGICLSKKRLDGKVALVTGGSAGLGYETALDLAKRGAEVIITARDMKKGEKAASNIRNLTKNQKVTLKRLDLSSQKDVKRFATEMQEQHPKLHYLVNNAGMVGDMGKGAWGGKVAAEQRKDTEDGFEEIMATNFLGPVTLTEMLLESIKAAGAESSVPARIVNVSSHAHMSADLNASKPDLNYRKKNYNCIMQYNNSKLAQILYTNALARKLEGFNIESTSLHPGAVRTEIFRNIEDWRMSLLTVMAFWLLGKNCWQGAQTSIYAVVTEKSVNGKFLSDCGEGWLLSKKVGNPDEEDGFYKAVKKLLAL